MTHQERSLDELQKSWHGSMRAYVAGFIASVILTAASFLLAGSKIFKGPGLVFTLVGLGVVQAVAQLLFFLHVGQETKPRWETLIFLFMVLVLLIIVAGTLWIMYDLNMRVMPPMED